MPLLDRANRLLQMLMVICLSLMAIMVFLNVVLRYVFNSSLDISEELSRYFFVWLTFLGSISVFAKGKHIKVDMLYRRMPLPVRRVANLFGSVAMLVCCVLLFVGCWRLAMSNMHNALPISGVPVGVLYFAGVPCSFAIGCMLIRHLWLALCRPEQWAAEEAAQNAEQGDHV